MPGRSRDRIMSARGLSLCRGDAFGLLAVFGCYNFIDSLEVEGSQRMAGTGRHCREPSRPITADGGASTLCAMIIAT